MPTGTLKKWSELQGFGFITASDGSRDYFVHHSGIKRKPGNASKVNLKIGAKVSFQEQPDPKGTKAVEVEYLD